MLLRFHIKYLNDVELRTIILITLSGILPIQVFSRFVLVVRCGTLFRDLAMLMVFPIGCRYIVTFT